MEDTVQCTMVQFLKKYCAKGSVSLEKKLRFCPMSYCQILHRAERQRRHSIKVVLNWFECCSGAAAHWSEHWFQLTDFSGCGPRWAWIEFSPLSLLYIYVQYISGDVQGMRDRFLLTISILRSYSALRWTYENVLIKMVCKNYLNSSHKPKNLNSK